MCAYKLSSIEMKALEYLARMPNIEEKVLAKLLSLPLKDTRRLKNKISRILGIISFPNFRMLGWEMMFIAYSLLPPKRISGAAVEGCSHCYISSDQFLAIGFAQNYAELIAIYEKLCIELEISNLQLLAFPYELITTLRFFDYSGIILNLTGNVLFEYPKDFNYTSQKSLSVIEKKILFEVVKEPRAEVEKVSERLGVKQSTVRRMITRLKNKGYFLHLPALNLEEIGYSGFAFYHFKIEKEGFELKDLSASTFFEIVGLNNAFLMVAYTDPEEIFAWNAGLSSDNQSQAISIVNYGCFQFSDLKLRKENDYTSVLKRNRNFGDWFEGNLLGREGRKHKTHTRNR